MHWIKLLFYWQVLQPEDPPYVVSLQIMHRFDTKMPTEQLLQVDPSIQILQLTGQLKQWSW